MSIKSSSSSALLLIYARIASYSVCSKPLLRVDYVTLVQAIIIIVDS
jgi:hypothetical protein